MTLALKSDKKCCLQGLNPKQAKEVSHLALVPVANGTRLVPPSSLYVRLRDDLSPFAFELPTSLVGHSTTLQELGMKGAPTAADLIAFLQVSAHQETTAGHSAHIHICATKLSFSAWLLQSSGPMHAMSLRRYRCMVSETICDDDHEFR